MENAHDLFVGTDEQVIPSFLKYCLQYRSETSAETNEMIEGECQKYANLMGLLDAIWSSVRRIDCGLLPTQAQIEQLSIALTKCRKLWVQMGLSTKQPKWHLTFDGHLLYQVGRRGGLADKGDDSIERFHQILNKLRERFQATGSYETRGNCIRKELR
jgi:hypothetical protein